MNILYSLKGINFKYQIITKIDGEWAEITALNNLSLNIYENEFLLILGANGSGKSSLGKLLAGLAHGYSGDIIFRGEKITSYRRDIFRDVMMVLQEPQNQLLMPTVARELAYPLENRGVERSEISSRILEYSELFGLEQLLDKSPDELSGGQITSLAIATALITDPAIIILDEPDSHLDPIRESRLSEFIERYRGRKTIILITQYLHFTNHADRVAIMKDGAILIQGKPAEISDNGHVLFEANLISKRADLRPKEAVSSHNDADPVILLNDISYSFPAKVFALAHINLRIKQGERVGIFGDIGAGKSTLGLIMSGLLTPQAGQVSIKNKPIRQYDEKMLREIITMTMQFPERAMFEETVSEDIACGPVNLGRHNIESLVNEQLGRFEIKHLRERHPFTLSGGEKRRAALAGVLAMDSEITILDEPTAALDPRSSYAFARTIVENTGKTYIIISHDLEFLKSTCTRFVEMDGGKILSDDAEP